MLRFQGFGALGCCLKSQVAQNNRLPYPKVAHNWLKVAPKYRLLAFQVKGDSPEELAELPFRGR